MDGILPMLFWGAAFGLFALVLWGVIRLQKRFWPTERDLAERREQRATRPTAQKDRRSSERGQAATTLADTRPPLIQRPPMAPREWLTLVNHRPDQVPHLF